MAAANQQTPPRTGPRQRSRLTGIAKTARTDQVRERIQRAIEEGEFGPGDRLPSERQFVEMLGVSRVSVREAMRALEAVGIVEVFHGRGSFVATDRNEAYASSFRGWLAVHRDEVFDLLRIRGALDELAAELAAEQQDAESLKHIAEAQKAFRRTAEEPDPSLADLVSSDVAFHDAVARASGSPLLVDLLGDLHTSMAESRQATLSPPGRALRSVDEHDTIVAAIVAGDELSARSAAAGHIESVRKAISQFIDSEPEE